MSNKHWEGEYHDFIGVYKNVIDQKHCNAFLEWVDWCEENNYVKPSWTPGDVMMKPQEHQLDVTGQKRDTVLNSPIKFHHPDKYVDQFPNALADMFWINLNKCLEEYILKYQVQLYSPVFAYGFKLHKVEKGEGYHVWHYEDNSHDGRNRVFAFHTCIKAPEEGGETEFLHQSKRFKQEVGQTLIWPVGFTHQHRGNPVLQGEKVYITGWFHRSATYGREPTL